MLICIIQCTVYFQNNGEEEITKILFLYDFSFKLCHIFNSMYATMLALKFSALFPPNLLHG